MIGKMIYRRCRRAFHRAIGRAWNFKMVLWPAYAELRPCKLVVPQRISRMRRLD
jgi:hypothetical protein